MAQGKRRTATLTARDLKNVRTALNKVGGSWGKLHRAVEGSPRRRPGRPPSDFFNDISVTQTPWKGVFCVKLRIAGAAPWSQLSSAASGTVQSHGPGQRKKRGAFSPLLNLLSRSSRLSGKGVRVGYLQAFTPRKVQSRKGFTVG
jgi:hypothetical protein